MMGRVKDKLAVIIIVVGLCLSLYILVNPPLPRECLVNDYYAVPLYCKVLVYIYIGILCAFLSSLMVYVRKTIQKDLVELGGNHGSA